ncbi:hypothetical protein, partial [Foetidibacter luteolus]|uniref:hypothetical protein n=1 Tax=Foetidibacter luteolus TaxID=2608880 RepID=UPI001A99DBDE
MYDVNEVCSPLTIHHSPFTIHHSRFSYPGLKRRPKYQPMKGLRRNEDATKYNSRYQKISARPQALLL